MIRFGGGGFLEEGFDFLKEALAEGLELFFADAADVEQLGIGCRTLARHVAELMERVGLPREFAGRRGAQAGIFMPAHPRVGATFRQEYFKGHAEDHVQIVTIRGRRMKTKEWTPLEPGVLDHKFYARGIGTVLEQTVKGGVERNELVSFSAPS